MWAISSGFPAWPNGSGLYSSRSSIVPPLPASFSLPTRLHSAADQGTRRSPRMCHHWCADIAFERQCSGLVGVDHAGALIIEGPRGIGMKPAGPADGVIDISQHQIIDSASDKSEFAAAAGKRNASAPLQR